MDAPEENSADSLKFSYNETGAFEIAIHSAQERKL